MTRFRRETKNHLGLDCGEWEPFLAADLWFTERPVNPTDHRRLIYVSPEGDTLPDAIAASVDDPQRWVTWHVGETPDGWDVWGLRPLPTAGPRHLTRVVVS